ncbi:MAG: UvrD-helicase domain-containing protein [Desulfarculus sp.]|nr:UvrD-helicase domain-containing protein [Desulfarculus sp.]
MPDNRPEMQALTGNLCLTAGAGAGKTYHLVGTYLGLLAGEGGAEPLPPEAIVAITFTEKAALEMRLRVAQAVGALAREGAPGPDWAALLARVEWAPISTIHSFCAQLLREHGALLGLDPEFAVLDQDAYAELVAEVIADHLRPLLREAQPGLLRLLRDWSLGGISERLTGLLAQLATQGLTIDQARAASLAAHDAALATGPELARRVELAVAEMVRDLEAGRLNQNTKFASSILELKDILAEKGGALWAGEGPDPQRLERVLALLGGNWGKAKPLKDAALEAAQGLAELAMVPEARQRVEDLLDLAQGVAADLERELLRRSALSFDHLLLRALELLETQTQVREVLRARHRAVLVDEYQDVNPVQGRLVQVLTGLDQPGDGEVRCLLVGDRKQSIYAFRGADLTEFGRVMRHFADGAGQLAALPNNYRSRPELVEFFNRLFPVVFSGDDLEEHAPGAFVQWADHDSQTARASYVPSAEPVLEVLDISGLAPEEETLPLAVWRRLEARNLAAHLDRILAAGARPGDIALLFRKLRQVDIYEQALREAGLDFYTVRGRGFYACPEIGDLLLGLRATLDPDDDLALAGWLRSPGVGLSDEALVWLAQPAPGQALGLNRALAQGLELPDWLGPEQAEAWRAARRSLGRLRRLARRLTPAELVEELLAAGDLVPLLAAGAGGEQKIANLRKLLEGARAAGRSGVEGFVRDLQALVESPPDDAQAPLLGEGADVIRLMTIHQAKGLEFPIVALPDLDSPPGGGGGQLTMGSDGVLAVKVFDHLSGRWQPTPLTRAAAQRQQALAAAESARLFYVACTRARERLIFCLHGGQAKNYPGRWRPWIETAVLTDPAVVILGPDDGAGASAPVAGPDSGLGPDLLPVAPGPRAGQGRELVRRCLEHPSRPLGRVQESVSGIEDWLACPRRYWFTRRWGLDTASLAGPPGQTGAGQGGAAELGSQVHRLLERIDLWAGPLAIPPALEALGLEPELRQAVQRRVEGWWQTALPDIIARLEPHQVRREEPFSLLLDCEPAGPELELIGEIDLLLLPDDEPPLIVDYKVSDHPEPEKYRPQMALYTLAVWLGLGRPDPPPRAALIFLGRQETFWRELVFSASDLERWRADLMEAGRRIARLPVAMDPAELPPGPECPGGACPLARHGLCQPPQGGTA